MQPSTEQMQEVLRASSEKTVAEQGSLPSVSA